MIASPDRLAMAAALYEALKPDPFYAALEGQVTDPARARAAMLDYYLYSLEEAAADDMLLTPPDGDYGASIWSRPKVPDAQSAKSAAKLAFLEEKMGPACASMFAAMAGSMAQGTGTVVQTDDWYLSILGIAPEQQGGGRGANLVRPMLERADAAGVACYLETFTPGNMGFYERQGFRAVGQFAEASTGAPYWVMRRTGA